MPIPCESTPRRSVRTMRSEVTSAMGRGIFIAVRAATMNVCRWVPLTVIAVSAMIESSQARDLDPRVLDLVPAVDRRQDRGDALERPGVRQPAHVDRPQSDRTAQLDHLLLGLGVLTAQQEI